MSRYVAAFRFLGFTLALVSGGQELFAADWPSLITTDPRGTFPNLRPCHAVYAFGWSGITAATAEVALSTDSETVTLEGKGQTIGLARALWRFDVDYRSSARADTLRPLQTRQDEVVRSKRIVSDLDFSEEGVKRTRTETGRPPKTKEFKGTGLNDLFSALLYLRSQPLAAGATYRLAVYPANSAYLASVTVTGREKIQVRAGKYNALKLDLKVQRIGKKGALEPYKKLKRATVWVSDDDDRMLLRSEGQILIGTVTTELQSLRFD